MSTENNRLTIREIDLIIEWYNRGETYDYIYRRLLKLGYVKTRQQISKIISENPCSKRRRTPKLIENNINYAEIESKCFVSMEERMEQVKNVLTEKVKIDKVDTVIHQGKQIDVLSHWLDTEGNLRKEYKHIALHLNL